MKKKLILICDTKNEIDDQFAIAYALNSPEIDLLGVISTQNTKRDGESSIDVYHKEAQKILKLANSEVPAFKGARHPFDLDKGPEKSPGSKFVIDISKKERVLVVCMAPATDIINICLLDPTIKKRVKFLWLGGKPLRRRRFISKRGVNYIADPIAAKMLLYLEINLTFVPTFGTNHLMFARTGKMQRELREKNTPLTLYLADLIDWNKRRIIKHKPQYLPLSGFWYFCDLVGPAFAKKIGIKKIKTHGTHRIVSRVSCRQIFKDFAKVMAES